MRMRFWASAPALAVVLAAPQGQAPLPSGGHISYAAAGTKTRLAIETKSGKRYEASVERDSMVAAGAQPSKVEVIGEVPGKAVILTDRYASVPLGMHYCQAGEERFLRVITLAGGRGRDTLHLKIASCRDNLELAEPGLEWNAENATLRIHWLQGPSKKEEERTIRIGKDGRPVN